MCELAINVRMDQSVMSGSFDEQSELVDDSHCTDFGRYHFAHYVVQSLVCVFHRMIFLRLDFKVSGYCSQTCFTLYFCYLYCLLVDQTERGERLPLVLMGYYVVGRCLLLDSNATCLR